MIIAGKYYLLTENACSHFKNSSKKLIGYATRGEKVKCINVYGNVAIVAKDKQDGFPIETKLLIEYSK